jgi:hypothetical protein
MQIIKEVLSTQNTIKKLTLCPNPKSYGVGKLNKSYKNATHMLKSNAIPNSFN